MNANSSSNSPHSNSSALPAFVPAFYASSYGDDLDDDELEFSPEHVHSANTIAFASNAATIPASTMSAPPMFSYAAAASAHHHDEDDDDNALFVPKTTYRDTHHVFANGPCDLVFHSDAFLESSVFSHAGKAPTFVLESAATVTKQQKSASLALPLVSASPLSPSSYSAKVDVPQKESASYFCVNPVLSSRAAPSVIMAALEAALRQFECEFEVVQHWTIRATLLCVAEEIAFTLSLARVGADAYEVDFLHRSGDETKFVHIAEHLRALCADIDDDALPLCLQEPLDAWFDATQELTGRQYVIKDKAARELLATLTSSDQHPDTLYEFAKTLKDHCRVKQNRKLFVQSDRAGLLETLKWLLGDSDECARFGVFILAQFAKDCSSGSADASLFETPFDKSAFMLLLDDVRSRQRDAPCSKFALAMVERVQQSELFC